MVEDKPVQTLLQQGLKWKIIENYHVGTLMLRKAQINGLSQSTIKFLNEYRWKSSNNYSDPNEVTDSELMSALIQFESQREQDFQERKDRQMTSKRKSSRSKSRSRTNPKYRTSNSPPARKKTKKFCQVCKDNGKDKRIYTNHNTEECHFRPDKVKSYKKAPKKDYRKREARHADQDHSSSSESAYSSTDESERKANVMRRRSRRKSSKKVKSRAHARASKLRKRQKIHHPDLSDGNSSPEPEREGSPDIWMEGDKRYKAHLAQSHEEDRSHSQNTHFHDSSPNAHE